MRCDDVALLVSALAEDGFQERTEPVPVLSTVSALLIAMHLNVSTCKSLGNLETDLHRGREETLANLYLARKVDSFGGGLHGYRAPESVFSNDCFKAGTAKTS
ncbi:hypothetical protein GO986_22245 [Deinococcus sp. HMF7620]|uniref:Uncharacterized protein n=1 Tax=Deinococcus arboris TaxID=2682977 RepID=A0A7C9MC01_9DEIO|nr:hypothetical protein [Deinococcus arboris]